MDALNGLSDLIHHNVSPSDLGCHCLKTLPLNKIAELNPLSY